MTVSAFKKQLLKRIAQYEIKLYMSKSVSPTRRKHMSVAFRGVEMIIADINPKWKPAFTAPETPVKKSKTKK